MAARRALCAALAACVASGLEGTALAESDIALSDLAAEDACHGATDVDQCTLSLRQLRGRQQSVELDEPNPLEGSLFSTGPTGDVNVTHAVMYTPFNGALAGPSGAPLHTFYMYRVTSNEPYPPLNVNAGNIAGVLWYLHHEVVVQYPRKFDISKIVRYKVSMKATNPLWNKGMNFGVRAAFDKGQATGPFACGREWQNRTNTSAGIPEPKFCNGPWQTDYNLSALDGRIYSEPYEWSEYGYFVGCNKLGEFPFPTYPVAYPGATWYSLPGACPGKPYDQESEECVASEPGGFCGAGVMPTGKGDCTWTYENAGEIGINELVGIPTWEWEHFMDWGKKEYDPYTDEGLQFTWWNGINNVTENRRRINETETMFAQKYPDNSTDEDMPAPPCDFNYEEFYKEFFMRNINDEDDIPCEEPEANSQCFKDASWAKSDGIYGHPEWYPGLSPSSELVDFQKLFWTQGTSQCPKPCLS